MGALSAAAAWTREEKLLAALLLEKLANARTGRSPRWSPGSPPSSTGSTG
jgi:hypothetical protein